MSPGASDVAERLAKAEAFKALTHRTLDSMKVPTCEGAPCRIAARLAWVEMKLEQLNQVANEANSLRERVKVLEGAATLARIELAFCVHVAGRKGGKYEAALNAIDAALSSPAAPLAAEPSEQETSK